MRRISLFLICSFILAGEFDPPDVRIDMPREEFSQIAELWRISSIGLTKDGHNIVAGKRDLLVLLDSLKVPYSVMIEREREKEREVLRFKNFPSAYFNPVSFEEWATVLVNNHSEIAQLIQVGTSVQGRPLWAIKITDNPDIEEFEPELRIIGNIHGDEKSGLMVCADAMEWILTNYESNQLATDLVNGTEMWFMPMVNPDGNATTPQPSRSNANGVDLNRNFDGPDGWDDGDFPFSEPETQAVKALSDTYGNVFLLGLTFHSGETCFNSVWNYSRNAYLPDLGNFFSSRTGGMPCSNSLGCAVPAPDSLAQAYFDGNTYPNFWYVFGADWYRTWGDTNDWAYFFESTLDTTIEVTESKTPPDSEIPIFTQQHRFGVLNYLACAFQGIEGLVTDALSGSPLNAQITVDAFPMAVRTDPVLGDYHRFCVPGTYSLTVTADGYLDKTVAGISVSAKQLTRVDVQLVSDTLTYLDLLSFWPGEGPFDTNANGHVDVQDILNLL